MQSQAFYGADTAIHAQLMRHFDRNAIEPHVACTVYPGPDPAMSALYHLREVPDLRLRPTYFGPTLHREKSRWGKVGQVRYGPATLASLLSLAAYVHQHRIQVIHCTEKPRDAFYGVLLARVTGARAVIQMHVGYGNWQSNVVKWALRQADAIVGVSQFVAQSICDAGYPKDRVFAVHNSLDLSSWDDEIDGCSTRRALGIPHDRPVLGIVSRLFKWKGHSELIRALALVRTEFPSALLVIVGEDDPRANPGGGSYRVELETLVQQLGLESNVMFTGFRMDIPNLMAAFDVFVHPSWEEPFGMVFLEAMAMHKPVVALASGGAPEVIVQGETGFLAEQGSIPSLAEAILTLLRDPALRRRLGDRGRRRVEEDFSPARMCDAMARVYGTVLSDKLG